MTFPSMMTEVTLMVWCMQGGARNSILLMLWGPAVVNFQKSFEFQKKSVDILHS